MENYTPYIYGTLSEDGAQLICTVIIQTEPGEKVIEVDQPDLQNLTTQGPDDDVDVKYLYYLFDIEKNVNSDQVIHSFTYTYTYSPSLEHTDGAVYFHVDINDEKFIDPVTGEITGRRKCGISRVRKPR